MVVFLTNAKKDLYKRDLLNVACKNEGDKINFSYDNKYCEKGFKPAEGNKVLIIFGEYPDNKYKYHSVRYCTIEKIIEYETSESTDYHLRLEGFFLYADDNNTAIADAWHQAVIDDIAKKEKTTKPEYFIRNLDDSKLPRTQNIGPKDAWPNLVKYLGNLTDLEKCVFFQQVEAKKSTDLKDRDPAKPTPIHWDSNKLYEIQFLVRAGKSLIGKAVFPVVTTNSNIACQGPFISQTGNAIKVRYVLATTETLKKKYSPITIKSVDATDAATSISPEFSNFVEIAPKSWLVLLSFALLFIGIGFPQLAEVIFSKESTYCFLNFCFSGEHVINGIKIFSFAFLAIGSFIVYGKFPKGGD
jgi:hypothetical protein